MTCAAACGKTSWGIVGAAGTHCTASEGRRASPRRRKPRPHRVGAAVERNRGRRRARSSRGRLGGRPGAACHLPLPRPRPRGGPPRRRVSCIDSAIAEIVWLARTITTWREEFLAYFSAGRLSNGPTEAVNLRIKKIRRVGQRF